LSEAIANEVRRFRSGDQASAEVLARRACGLALRTAAAIMGSRTDASDVAQDVAVDVLLSLHRLRDAYAFDAWVHRITVRHALRTLRRDRAIRLAERPLALLTEREEPLAPEGPDYAALVTARSALASALAELPPKQRLALALRYVHDLSDAQIAIALECRAGTAHSLLSRGRAALRRDARLSDLAPTATAGGQQ
jgi:RNA polymerase sigma-70 factor (ECF subfamily)